MARKPRADNASREPAEPVPVDMHLMTASQFASKVGRTRHAVYRWIRTGQMPEGSVVMVHGRLMVDWAVFKIKGIKPVM